MQKKLGDQLSPLARFLPPPRPYAASYASAHIDGQEAKIDRLLLLLPPLARLRVPLAPPSALISPKSLCTPVLHILTAMQPSSTSSLWRARLFSLGRASARKRSTLRVQKGYSRGWLYDWAELAREKEERVKLKEQAKESSAEKKRARERGCNLIDASSRESSSWT